MQCFLCVVHFEHMIIHLPVRRHFSYATVLSVGLILHTCTVVFYLAVKVLMLQCCGNFSSGSPSTSCCISHVTISSADNCCQLLMKLKR